MEQRTKEWHELRRTKIGSSDAPCIMGVGFKTPFQVWKEKVFGERQDDSWSDKPFQLPEYKAHMQYGIDKEDEVRNLFGQKRKVKFEPSVIISKRNPFMMASFDGVCGSDYIEIKCPGEEDHDIACGREIPVKYLPQLHHQMEVADVRSMTYLSYYKGDLREVELEIDEEYVKILIAREKAFWDLVMSATPPEMTDRDRVCKDNDPMWVEKWNKAKDVAFQIKTLESILENEKEELIRMAEGRSVEGMLGKLTRYYEKGRVNYKAVPELIGVNLDAYRKDPTEKWKLTFA